MENWKNMKAPLINRIRGNKTYLNEQFKETDKGYIAYKIFGKYYTIEKDWKIEKGSIIKTDHLDHTIHDCCSYGINIATKSWIRDQCDEEYFDIWEVLIPNDATIVVPGFSIGKIRTNKIVLLRIVRKRQKNSCEKCRLYNPYSPHCKSVFREPFYNNPKNCRDYKKKWFKR